MENEGVLYTIDENLPEVNIPLGSKYYMTPQY